MDYKNTRNDQENVSMLLHNKRIKEALDILSDLVKKTHDSKIIDNHYNLEMSYKSLLRYTVEGFTDPERQKIYSGLLVEIYHLSDSVFFTLNTNFEISVFYEIKRKQTENPVNSLNETYNNLSLALEKEELMSDGNDYASKELKQLFNKLFELLLCSKEIYSPNTQIQISSLFKTGFLPWPQQCILTSAVTIHLFHYFNLDALYLLFDLLKHPEPEVIQRALVGLLIILYKYDNRLWLYPEIKSRLEVLKKQLVSESIMHSVIIQIMRTRETEKLARKLTDEILPEVAKIHPDLRNRLDLDNILGDKFKEGKNPDWEDIFSDSPDLMNKLEEFSKLQMEGSDLFLSTFRMLKHFSFFDKYENWFLPFYYPNKIIDEILKNESQAFQSPDLLNTMTETGILCNSDKYSLILSIPQMPESQKEMMGKMFLSEISAMREIEKSDELIGPDKQLLTISNQYIQDLYRLFRVHPKKDTFDDPFSWKLDFYNRWFIQYLYNNDEFYLKLGEYLFNKDEYADALECFKIAAKHTKPSMQLIQQQAFCYQQLKQYNEALELYIKAELFDHQQVWNLKKIALCYRYLNQPEKALDYYLKVEKIKPEDLHNQVSIGHCLLEIKNFEEALKYYFKVEYLDPGNKKVWRPIVWCALALGKFEQAEKYCIKLLDDEPTAHDFINMGHIKWCNKKREEALQWYKKWFDPLLIGQFNFQYCKYS